MNHRLIRPDREIHKPFCHTISKGICLKLSVIIPVYGAQTLPDCLSGLRASIRWPDEIIIVDDGSPEGSKPGFLPDVRLIRMNDGPAGPAKARNRGARESTGEIIVFVDADVVVHPDALGIIQSIFLEDSSLGAVFGSYDDAAIGGIVTSFKNLLHHYIHQRGRSEASTFWAGLGAVRRKAFDSIGGFDETLSRLSLEDSRHPPKKMDFGDVDQNGLVRTGDSLGPAFCPLGQNPG